MIILPDADFDLAIPGAARAIFNATGQVCSAGSRLYAHKDVFDEVVRGVDRFAKTLKIGPGLRTYP